MSDKDKDRLKVVPIKSTKEIVVEAEETEERSILLQLTDVVSKYHTDKAEMLRFTLIVEVIDPDDGQPYMEVESDTNQQCSDVALHCYEGFELMRFG